jgi:TonB family protein
MESSMQTLSSLASFFFQTSLKATLLVVLILVAQKLLGKFLSANGRYLLWATMMVSLVMPFGFNVDLPITRVAEEVAATPAPTAEASSPQTAIGEFPRSISRAGEAAQAQEAMPLLKPADEDASPYPWLSLLPYAWLSGVFAVLGAIAVASLRFSRLVRHARPAPEPLQRLLQQCIEQTSCRSIPALLHSADIHVPMIAGLFHPVLLLPEGIEQQVTRVQLRHIFMHELMHMQRGDIVGNWIMAVLQSLHWFNPAIWFAFACMRQDRELACDAATVRHLDAADRASYGHTLLQLNDVGPRKSMPILAVGILESPAHLRQRILMLVRNPRYDRLRSLFTAMLFIPFAAVAFSQPAPGGEGSAAAQAAAAARPTPGAAPAAVNNSAPAPRPMTPAMAVASEAPTAPELTSASIPTLAAEEHLNTAEDIQAVVSAPSATQPPLLVAQRAADVDALSVQPSDPPGSAARRAAEPASEAYADMPYIRLLTEKITAVQTDKVAFVKRWNDIGEGCEAGKERFLGAMSTDCQRIRSSLRRGEILTFGRECFELNSLSAGLYERYREAAANQSLPADIEEALRANEARLAEFCSKDRYSTQYPGFAAIFAEAEAMDYSESGSMATVTDRDIVPLERVNPDYPLRALARGMEGWVHIEFTVSETGAVVNPVVVDASRDGIFEDAALKAITRWRYEPKVENGVGVQRQGLQTIIRFQLRDG